MPLPLKGLLESEVFAAHSCSCSCDPCICKENCGCDGADAYLGPRWRVLGQQELAGELEGVDLAGRTLLQLAMTSDEESEDWQELVLLDEHATQKQVDVLLHTLQGQQQDKEQLPPVFQGPIHYLLVEQRPTLCVHIVPQRLRSVLAKVPLQLPLQTWSYNGHVALLEQLDPRVLVQEGSAFNLKGQQR